MVLTTGGACWCLAVLPGASWCLVLGGACWGLLVLAGAFWCLLGLAWAHFNWPVPYTLSNSELILLSNL